MGSESNDEEKVCTWCGYTFVTLPALTTHMKLTGHNNTECPKCPGVKLNSWSEHKQHQSMVHNGVFFFRCRNCPEVFESTISMHKHRKEKHWQSMVKVQYSDCGLLVPRIRLKHHQKHKHFVKVKGFVTQDAFDNHMNTHTG